MTILRDCDGPDDAAAWADRFDLTMPVYCDASDDVWTDFNPDLPFPYKPQCVVIDRDMTILANEWDIDAVENAEETVIDNL